MQVNASRWGYNQFFNDAENTNGYCPAPHFTQFLSQFTGLVF